jgi:hypothetical protein
MEMKVARARALATEIDGLLATLDKDETLAAGYQMRLAQGLTRNLIDQLSDIEHGPLSSKRPAAYPMPEDAELT